MTTEYFQIKDKCRKGLLPYLAKAFSLVPKIEKPKILDIGCGTGVPTLWLAENNAGKITAIDTDTKALDWLQEKIADKNLENQISTIPVSFFNLELNLKCFNIILAEGFLNVVGFEMGYPKVIGMLEKDGYFIIHDEYRDHEKKCDIISKNRCKLIATLFLDETVWWNDYYKQLENEINAIKVKQIKDSFKSDLKEIECYKSDPTPFKSIYYIVKKL